MRRMNRMDKIIHLCDHCGKELTDKEYKENTYSSFLYSGNGIIAFCDDCFKEVDEILKRISEKREELKNLNDVLDDYVTKFEKDGYNEIN